MEILLIFGVVTSELVGDEITAVHGGWTLDVLSLYLSVGPTLILEVEFGNLLVF